MVALLSAGGAQTSESCTAVVDSAAELSVNCSKWTRRLFCVTSLLAWASLVT